MAFNALEHGNIAQVNGMLKGFVGLVAGLAFAISLAAEIDRVLKGPSLHILSSRPCGVIDHSVADVAVVGDDFTRVADVFAVMTAETA